MTVGSAVHKTPPSTPFRGRGGARDGPWHPNARIAPNTGLHLDRVRTWWNRFANGGLPALADRKRSGRPP
ncbi:helix-turn-helix domain-containing protein [Streptomyces bauhiniae]|uniref:helix-turn-helix domain-containing protein n=1 Tax=Streptomyces bauhiniae TaxID=2340725 RepID=UPI00406BB4CA